MNKQKRFLAWALIVILVAIIISTGIAFRFYKNNLSKDISTPGRIDKNTIINVCTRDVKGCSDGTFVSRNLPNCEFAACPVIVGIENKLIINSPKPTETIANTVSVRGKVIGTWFFEAIFPVQIYDTNDRVLGSGQARFVPQPANDTWMTDQLVNFQGEIKFNKASTDTGYILFKKYNPSGLPEKDESYKLPIKFSKGISFINTSGQRTYRNEEYGFEITYPGALAYAEVDQKNHIPNDIPEEYFGVHFYSTTDAAEKLLCGTALYVDVNNLPQQDMTLKDLLVVKEYNRYLAYTEKFKNNKEVLLNGRKFLISDGAPYLIAATIENERYYIIEMGNDEGGPSVSKSCADVYSKFLNSFKIL
jgi:hypothetical protein